MIESPQFAPDANSQRMFVSKRAALPVAENPVSPELESER